MSASEDLLTRYGGKEGQPGRYSDDVVDSCLEKLVERPILAVQWNSMGERAKDVRIKRWA
jgi:hypothetical protein